jgi:hypothetical protein
MLSLAACGGGKDPADTTNGTDPAPATDDTGESITDANGNVLPANLPEGAINAMRETFDSMEYTMYMNVFQDTSTKQYDGIEMTKVGTFAVLQDEWSGKTRYYVWGFADQTRCCDFQWEFVPSDVGALPNPGAYIRVKGTFTYTEEQQGGALDHYWLTDTTVDVLEDYTPSKFDYDLTVMSATLARVQLFSIQNYSDKFADKTMLIYGRVLGPNTLQHPYYDNSWNLDFKTADDKNPGIGQYLVLGGRIVSENGGCWLEATTYQEV